MNITLGSLRIVSALLRGDLIAPEVFEALKSAANSEFVGVAEIDPTLSDTAAFCEHYEIGMNQAANCVVLEAKRAERSWLAACVILGSTRADVNGLARKTLDARKVSFAPMDMAVSQSHMEFGAITPVGLPKEWSILIDKAVVESEYVVIGSGIRKSKLVVSGRFLETLPGVLVLDGLGMTVNRG